MNLKGVLGINRVPNGKGDTNSNGPVSLNDLGGNLDYPNASPQRRATIAQAHLRWAQGLTPGVQFGGNFGNGGGTDVG